MKTSFKNLLLATALIAVALIPGLASAGSVSKTFTSTVAGNPIAIESGTSINYDISGTFVGTVLLERSRNGGQTWETEQSFTSTGNADIKIVDPANSDTLMRFRCSAYTSGSIVTVITEVAEKLVEYKNDDGEVVFSVYEDGVRTGVDTGTIAAGATSLVDHGNTGMHKTVFTLTGETITLTDEAGVGQYGSLQLYDFPEGNIAVLGAVVDANITLVDTEWVDTAEGDVGVGTTAVTDGNALATTEQNIVPTTAIAALTAQVGPIDAISTATELAAGVFNGTATAANLFLNVRIDDNAAHITGTGTITGTVTVVWVNFGDK